MKIIEWLKSKSRDRRNTKISSLLSVLKDEDSNTGYRRRALSKLCWMAGGFRRIDITQSYQTYIWIEMEDGYEIYYQNWSDSEAFLGAGLEVVEYIKKKDKA